VRDHQRPAFHKALGIDIEEYDREVLRKTSEISKQVFPLEIDLENPRWERGLTRLRAAFTDLDAAKRRGGIGGFFGKAFAGARVAMNFAGLYLIPAKKNAVPESSHLVPAY